MGYLLGEFKQPGSAMIQKYRRSLNNFPFLIRHFFFTFSHRHLFCSAVAYCYFHTLFLTAPCPISKTSPLVPLYSVPTAAGRNLQGVYGRYSDFTRSKTGAQSILAGNIGDSAVNDSPRGLDRMVAVFGASAASKSAVNKQMQQKERRMNDLN